MLDVTLNEISKWQFYKFSKLLSSSSIIPISNSMTGTSPIKCVVLSLFPVPIIIHHYRVITFVVCVLREFRFFRLTASSWKLHPETLAVAAVQLYSCAARLSCQASYVPLSSAAHVLLYSTGFETTWPRISRGQQIQLGRCSANWSHFSSGGENTCCAVGVSSVAGNFVTEHAHTQVLRAILKWSSLSAM